MYLCSFFQSVLQQAIRFLSRHSRGNKTAAYCHILLINSDAMILECPVSVRTRLHFTSIHFSSSYLCGAGVATGGWACVPDVPLAGYAFPILPWEPEASPGQMGRTVKSLQRFLDLLPFGCAWEASKGRCPAWSDAHAAADAYNIPSFYLLYPFFHHVVARTRGCAIHLRLGRFQTIKIYRKKKCSVQNLCLGLLTE